MYVKFSNTRRERERMEMKSTFKPWLRGRIYHYGGIIIAYSVRSEISLLTTRRYPSQKSPYRKTEP
jgi:hypothetical protein